MRSIIVPEEGDCLFLRVPDEAAASAAEKTLGAVVEGTGLAVVLLYGEQTPEGALSDLSDETLAGVGLRRLSTAEEERDRRIGEAAVDAYKVGQEAFEQLAAAEREAHPLHPAP